MGEAQARVGTVGRTARIFAIVFALCVGATPALGIVPNAQKIAEAVATTNQADRRSVPLLLEVSLKIGDRPPVATGVLASHPTGLARLELRSNSGFVERHLLQGSDYTASRDGELLGTPRPFLPPIFFLQTGSGAALQAALASFGVPASEVVLGIADERDCYVLGGRLPRGPDGKERRLPSLWVDMDSYEVVRIDRRDGVRFRFGPARMFDGIRAPAWIAIEAPDQDHARLEVLRVVPADAPAAAFRSDWLLSPENP